MIVSYSEAREKNKIVFIQNIVPLPIPNKLNNTITIV